ncbi:MAG: hypothetical protein IKX85_01175, partial [Clostridia bacterium]|nr:hypothetical protein [Clostridia bacterium]
MQGEKKRENRRNKEKKVRFAAFARKKEGGGKKTGDRLQSRSPDGRETQERKKSGSVFGLAE